MFKDCRCGRSIPSQWPMCGECKLVRTKVDVAQRMEGPRYRRKVALRAKCTLTLAQLRRPDETDEANAVELTEEEQAVSEAERIVNEAQEQALKVLFIIRLQKQMKLRRKLQHDNLAPALKEWMEDID